MKTLKKILSVILSAIVCLLNPCYVFADNFVQNGDNIIVIEENIPFEKAIILGDYDYFVAQHSDNYLAWASTYQNHWEEYESQGSTYGIIRP